MEENPGGWGGAERGVLPMAGLARFLRKRSGTAWGGAALLAIALAGGAAALARHGVSQETGGRVAGRIEPESVPVFPATGGRVAEVLARAGQPVKAGQLLLRMAPSELDRKVLVSLHALRSAPAAPTGSSALERVPLATWMRLERTDPARLAAEQEYVTALDGFERSPSAAGRARLGRAIARRRTAYESQAVYRASNLSALREAERTSADLAGWLERQLARLDVRATVGGVVELLDLSAGDTVAPLWPVALIDPAGRFTVEANIGEGRRAPRPGTRVDVLMEGDRRIAGVVESSEHGLRVSIVDPPIQPQPGDQVWILL
jgi:multidrug resistance efflux pump